MAAAIAAAEQNSDIKIQVLEHKDLLGKKILSTGNGRCNFTNAKMDASCFFSDTPSLPAKILNCFGTEDTLRFFERLGVLYKERSGYYYPRSNQASDVLSVLRMRLSELKVESLTGIHVTGIRRTKKGFAISADQQVLHADAVILCCGGRAAPVLGSDGSGYDLAKSLGHSIVPVVPALVQLKVKNHCLSKASGVRADVRVSVYQDGQFSGTDTGEMQITAYGISGIPVFQISRHAAKGIYNKKKVTVSIDFLPFMEEQEVYDFFTFRKAEKEKFTISEFLTGVFHQKLIPCLLRTAGIKEHKRVRDISKEEWQRFIRTCRALSLEIIDTNGFENAQVCAGGVRLDEIHIKTMESRYCKGLYFAGEILDADGICGGYNLQWAWASGTIAGKNAAGSEDRL